MRRLCLALLALSGALTCLRALAAPAETPGDRSVDGLLAEGEGLAASARALYDQAHGMSPSLERNARLSKAREALKLALAKYALVEEVSPERFKEVAAAVTDLRGMLFWCNKGMVVVVPPAPAPSPPPAPVPPPEAPPEAPVAPAPEPAPSPPGLSGERLKDLEACCGRLAGLYGRIEDCRDQIAQGKAAIADLFSLFDFMRRRLEGEAATGMRWDSVQAYERRRAALLEGIRQHEKRIQARLKEILRLEDELRPQRALLASGGAEALPGIAGWAAAHADAISEDMAGFLNRLLSGAWTGFTPLPRDHPVAEAGMERAAQERLEALLKAARQADAVQLALADVELRAGRLRKDLAELDAHWAWRQARTACAVSEPKQIARAKAALGQELAEAMNGRQRAAARCAEAARGLEAASRALEGVAPVMARAVEAWRLRQKALPEGAERALEAWTRRALGRP